MTIRTLARCAYCARFLTLDVETEADVRAIDRLGVLCHACYIHEQQALEMFIEGGDHAEAPGC